MISTVGRAWFIGILSIISFCLYGRVTLTIKDINGIPLKEVVAGYPCTIELIIEGAQRRMENPEIKGLDHFHLEGRETRMQMINGATTMTYGFRTRCNKPGTYTIGPARLSIEGKEYNSNTVTITVIAAKEKSDKHESGKPFARLHCAKKRAVVGEKVGMSMRFYYPNHDHLLRDVGNPMQEYTRKQLQGPFSGTEDVNGLMYHYIEWTWDMYFTNPGTIIIPAYSFDYDTPKDAGYDHLFTGFSLFFNRQQYDRHRIYSNTCTIEVDPLPDTTIPIQGVGQFSAFSSHITPAHAQQGDGMMLTLELVGDADFDAITLAPLTLPDVFKWYDSPAVPAQHVVSGNYKKIWEYVVQGLKPGVYEIPSQHFTYFDTKKRAVVTRSTEPHTVTIASQELHEGQPLDTRVAPKAEISSVPDASLAQSIDIVDPSGIRPIHETGQWYAYQERSIPLFLYLLLMAFPVCFVIVRWLYNNQNNRLQRVARKHFLFKQARLQLARAERLKNGSLVYPLFISVVSSCLAISESMVTDELVERTLQQAGLDDVHCHAWKQFFVKAAAYAFYTADYQHADLEDFFKQASQWLDVCEKCL